MPLIVLVILIGLPVLDVYATLRFAEALGVPGILLFLPGIGAGFWVMKREAQSMRGRLVGAIQSLSLHAAVFDTGRRLLAAILFLAPGFVSDVFALFLLLIPDRTLAPQSAGPGAGTAAPGRDVHRGSHRDARVVDGDYRRID